MRVDVTKEAPAVVPDDAEVPAAQETPETPKPQNTLKLLIADNRTALGPWAWMAAADITAFTAHYATPSLGWSFMTAAGASAAVTAGTLWRTRDARLNKKIKTLRTLRKVQKNARVAVAAGSLWELLAATWTPIGPHAGMQLTLLGGGLAIAAPHLWRNRRQASDLTEPVAEIEAPAAEDRRLTRFRDQFCQSGPLLDAHLHGLKAIPGGFRFEVALSIARRGTFRDVKALEDQIAALFDVPLDHVSVEPPANRSARRAVVTVLTETKAHEREEPWDGRSTYNPATGCFELGRFADASRSHWRLHVPGSGACCGIAAGVQGSGKTGTLHVVGCEAGQAKLCGECLDAGSCLSCQMRRICAIWMGDPQRQPFGVWKGHADIAAWGPMSCVRMLSWMHAAMRTRADYFGRMEWTDHLGRSNTGKGWFDPSPEFPMLLGIITEWPIIAKDPLLSSYALPLADDIGNEGRKVGVSIILDSQNADVDVLGDRELRNALTAHNAIGHQSDRLAKQMLGLEGNPADLPAGVAGLSYLRGFDKRSGIVQRTKFIREYARLGESSVDVREIAERIANDPITYDPAILQAITPLGYTGPGQILSDDDGWDLNALLGVEEEAEPEPAPSRPATPPNMPGPVPAHDVRDVRDALTCRTDADVFDLMDVTGLSALQVSRALDALIADGVAAQAPSGRYAPCA